MEKDKQIKTEEIFHFGREISIQGKGIYRMFSRQPTKKLAVSTKKSLVLFLKQPGPQLVDN